MLLQYIMRRFYITILLVFCQTISFSKDYDVLLFGAIGDGTTLNTCAIQSAIDKAYEDGGGRVIIPSGSFLSGSIILKSNVELHVSKKAILLGSTNPNNYEVINRWKALVMADSAINISISGKGVIDGQGYQLALNIDSLFYIGKIDSADYEFPEKRPKVTLRPQVIEFVNCNNINVSGITIRNSASWVQSYYMCTNLTIDGIRVESDTYWNNDGIDIIDCQKVRITNSYINASDDGICLKSYGRVRHGRPFCDSIYIANCIVRSSASAIKFGTASFGGFKNVTIEKIKVFDTFRSAIALESYGNGVLEKILIKDIHAVNTGNAIFIRIGRRTKKMNPGILKDVTIKNVKVQVPFKRPDFAYKIRGPALPFFHNIFPSSITALPGSPIMNLTLENIEITYPGRGNRAYANMPLSRLNEVPENAELYPEFSMFGELPAWGFYVRHVDGLTMKDIRIKIKKPDYRPALVFDDVKNLDLQSVQIVGDKKGELIIYNDVKQIK